jgi:hypothetical protein
MNKRRRKTENEENEKCKMTNAKWKMEEPAGACFTILHFAFVILHFSLPFPPVMHLKWVYIISDF